MTLTLNTAIQHFRWTLLYLWWSTLKLSLIAKALWFRTNKRWKLSYFWLYKSHNVTFTLKIESHFFAWHSGSWWCTTIPSLVTKGWKQTQPSGNKYVSRALHPSPLKTPQCFPYSSKIIHHTQRKKRSNVAAASQLVWTGTLKVGRKSMVQAEIIILCARTLHHCKTPRQPPLKKWL